MIDGNQLQGNQLFFSVPNGVAHATMSAKFHPPRPIVIEKIPISTTPPLGRKDFTSAMSQFKAISAESMSRAVELARRDLRKKKYDSASANRNRSRSQTKSTNIVHSRFYQEKQKKRQQRPLPFPVVIERYRTKPLKTANVQTEVVSQKGAGRKFTAADLPARSMSPPTRDVPVTHEDRVLNEICRLRMEMTKCLQQMKCIKENRDLQSKVGVKASIYAEDVEEGRRRRIRAEERAIRSARTIYMLSQQSSKLHNEIKKLDTKIKIDGKKGTLTSRLAALHRGVVRALQLLVQQMSDDETLQSVARDYRDLAIIIRQLSICCAQLEITNESLQAQDDLLGLIKDVAELNEIVEAEDPNSVPLRQCQSSAQEIHRRKSSHLNSASAATSYHKPIEKVRIALKNIEENVNAPAGELTADQRNAVLAHGIQRLLRNKTSKEMQLATISKLMQKKKRFKYGAGHPGRSRKGVILVHQNTNHFPGHDYGSLSDVVSDGYERYARSTQSARQKSTAATQAKQAASPIRMKSTQPTVETDWHFAEPTFSKSQKEVSTSREQSRRSSPFSSPPSTPRRARNSGNASTLDSSWRRDIENEIQSKIEPLLKNGQIATDVNKVTDEIIGELMEDMAKELHKRRVDNEATHQAAVLRDAPDVTSILIRLRQMELEQDEIRRRWVGLDYGEPKPRTGATMADDPGSPPPLEIVAGANRTVRVRSDHHSSPENTRSVEPVIFTKPIPKSAIRQTDFQIDKSSMPRKGVAVSLPAEVLVNIKQQVKNYEAFLKRHVNDKVEHFDPWRVVEEISDDILDGCLHDVGLELEDINNDIVDHVYQTEFFLAPKEDPNM